MAGMCGDVLKYRLYTSGSRRPSDESDVILMPESISWLVKAKAKNEQKEIYTKNIVTARCVEAGLMYRVDIHYATSANSSGDKRRLCPKCVMFYGEKDTCEACVDSIRHILTNQIPRRPQRLLAIVNPVSGRKRAHKIYLNRIVPLFELAGISVHTVVTERAKQSDALLANYDLTSIDGIVVVGGDGTFTEVAAALMKRTTSDAGVDVNQQNVCLPSPVVPLGLIAAGTGNGLAICFNNSLSITTATLGVILGDQVQKDVMTVHSAQVLMCYDFMLLGYGFLGNIISKAEGNRWLGLFRYIIGLASIVNCRIPFDAEIQYLIDNVAKRKDELAIEDTPLKTDDTQELLEVNKKENVMCNTDRQNSIGNKDDDVACKDIDVTGKSDIVNMKTEDNPLPIEDQISQSTSGDVLGEMIAPDPAAECASADKTGWQTFRGRVIGVDMFLVEVSSLVTEKYNFKKEYLSAGHMALYISKPCGLIAYGRELKKIIGKSPNLDEYEHIIPLKYVKAYRVRATSEEYNTRKEALRFNWDGDVMLLPQADFTVRCHKAVLPVYILNHEEKKT